MSFVLGRMPLKSALMISDGHLVTRYVAEQLVIKGKIPRFVKHIADCLKRKVGLAQPLGNPLSELDEVFLERDLIGVNQLGFPDAGRV